VWVDYDDVAKEDADRMAESVLAALVGSDVVVAMQQRNRQAVHSVKGVQASIQNEAALSERRIQRGVPLDAEALQRQLKHWALVLSLTVEAMQRDQ
jgi:hypothetical protein